MIFRMFVLLGAAAAAPAQAQVQTAPPQAASVDPERREAAARLISLMWPEGALQTLMGGMDETMGAFGADAALGMRVRDLPEQSRSGLEDVDPDTTLAELAERKDPHFRERARIQQRVISQEMATLFGRLEPEFRRTMVDVYARRFTAPELRQAVSFYETPAGRKLATESLTLIHTPEYREMMTRIASEMMQSMGGIDERIQAATAHLPAPPADEAR